jgi:hypothetical protein
LFRDEEITPEDEEKMIRAAADKIHDYGMDLVAVLFLQSLKPLSYIGGQFGRFMIYPFLYIIGGDISRNGEKFFTIFENRDNLEKLITLLEKKSEEKGSEREDKGSEREDKKIAEGNQTRKEASPKRGWRRFIPF